MTGFNDHAAAALADRGELERSKRLARAAYAALAVAR
jgi:hypothetical protein